MKLFRIITAVIACLFLFVGTHNAYAAKDRYDHQYASNEKLTEAPDTLSSDTGENVTETVDEQAEHREDSGLPQFNPESFVSQIFWLAITFIILFTFFSRKTLPEIGRVLQTREAHIQNDLDTAQKLRERAEAARLGYEKAMGDAQNQSMALFTSTEEQIRSTNAAKMDQFKGHASKEIQETEQYIEKAKKEAMDSIHTIAAEIASLAAKKIVGISTDIDQAKTVVRNINKKAA
jgi:F-type H+-transporting ATPase subunit b